jgi:hypothetical protein
VQKLVVEAGGHANLPTLVRNQSGIVDNYEIQVKGMPEEWWNATPPSVYLVPFGAPSGTYEQEVTLHFNPPRSAEAEARVWELEVVAVSRAQGGRLTKARVEITPTSSSRRAAAEIVTGRRRGERDDGGTRRSAARHRDQRGRQPERAHFIFAKQQFVADPATATGRRSPSAKRTLGSAGDRQAVRDHAHGAGGADDRTQPSRHVRTSRAPMLVNRSSLG